MHNSAIFQQQLGEFHTMMQSSTSHLPRATFGGAGWQPPQSLQHLPLLGHASMSLQVHVPSLGEASTLDPVNLETSTFGPSSDANA